MPPIVLSIPLPPVRRPSRRVGHLLPSPQDNIVLPAAQNTYGSSNACRKTSCTQKSLYHNFSCTPIVSLPPRDHPYGKNLSGKGVAAYPDKDLHKDIWRCRSGPWDPIY